jgi:hypothetical protein
MSTVKANAIIDASGGNTATINSMTPTSDSLQGFRNRIINGSFAVAQRGTSFTSTGSANNDDTYNLDRWYVLSDGNDAVDITQATDVPTGAKYSIGLDVETVNKKFGIAQIIENINCFDAIGGNVTLSFKARVTSTSKLDNVKCAVVAWSGTADSVTSDIISAWGVEGTNPTLIANATYENSPANLNVTTSWATYSVSAAVDTASTSNIIVFIWSDVTDTTAGDFLYITNVQLEVGSVATPFERRDYGRELAMCQRYFFAVTSATDNPVSVGYTTTASNFLTTLRYPVVMRAAPALSSNLIAGDKFRANGESTNSNSANNFVLDAASPAAIEMFNNGFSGLTVGGSFKVRQFTATGVFGLTAEL